MCLADSFLFKMVTKKPRLNPQASHAIFKISLSSCLINFTKPLSLKSPPERPFSITTPGFTFSKDYTSSSSKWSISWEKAAYLMLY